MPVNRKRVQIKSNAGSGGVTRGARFSGSGGRAVGQAWRELGNRAARHAADYSRAMASAAEEEGLALAKAAVFSQDEMGTPQLPPNAAERMGSIARRAYDGAIEERYAHQLTTAVRAQVADAHSANLYDMDAFLDDANGRLEAMAANVPEHMQGAFQQISTGVLADQGAQIGRRQGQLAISNARDRAPLIVDDAVQIAVDNVHAGYGDRAIMIVDQIFETIDKTGPEIMGPGKKRDAKKSALLRIGVARMQQDLGLADASPAELSRIATDLELGEDEELLKYFQHEGVDFDKRELAARAANEVRQLMGEANRRQSEAQALAKEAGQIAIIRAGGARDTQKNRSLLDQDLSRRAKIRRADGNGYRPLNMYDWANMDAEQRHSLVSLSKDAGFRPESMDKFFRGAMRGDDPELLAAGFELYRDLREAPNSRGESGVDLTADLPEKVKEIYGIAELLHGSGTVGQEGVQEAFQLWDSLKEEGDWSDDKWAKELYPSIGGGMFSGGALTPDNWQDRLGETIEDEIFGDVTAEPKEREEALRIFKTYYRAGAGLYGFEEAMEMTRQSMEGRWVETDYMNRRSSYAPEKWYPEPGAGGFVDAFWKADSAVNDALLDFIGIEKGEGVFLGIGSDALTRTRLNTFDMIAHEGIKEMVENHPDALFREEYKNDGELYIGGRDYLLKPASKGTPPVYHVMMKGDDGTVHSIGTLDVRQKYEDLTKIDVNFRAREEALQERKGEMLVDKFGRNGIDQMIAEELVKNPNRDPADIIEEFWGENFEMGEGE